MAKIAAVVALLGTAAAVVRRGRLHPALEAIRRAQGGAPAPGVSAKRKMLALVLAILAALVAVAGGTEVQLQIILDQAGFFCGSIDGVWGRKSEAALAAYARSLGIAPLASSTGAERAEALRFLNRSAVPLFKWHAISAQDVKSVTGPLPGTPQGKAALDALGYETLEEALAEKGHCSPALLRALNPSADWPNPAEGTQVVMPAVRRMEFLTQAQRRNLHWPKAAQLRVSLAGKSISAYDAKGALIAYAPCSIAAKRSNLPPQGVVTVSTMAQLPNYTWSPDSAADGTSKYILSPGPNNPVGLAWIGLSLPGYGIHGTPYPEQIGRAESHGCFRLANWCAVWFYNLVDTGVKVVIEN
ncbi:MAG: murein L,D-transpeptidase [Kiritimatiellae bacterium]|nr:murein L,D-transpeptidase [Kiritimatiellia bacterium]